MGIITVVLPVFAVIILGWLFKTWNLIKEDAGKHLTAFVKMIAIPALLLLALGSSTFEDIWNWSFVGTLGIPILALFFVSLYVIRIIMRKPITSAALNAVALSTSNVAMIGLPILYGVFGRKAMIPVALAIIMEMLLLGIALFFLEVCAENSNFSKSFNKAVRFVVWNPIMIAIIVGILYSLTALPIPSGIGKFLHMLEISIVPVALFMLGLSLDPSEFGKRFQSSFLVWLIKLVILPAVVLWIVTSFDLSPIWAIAAVIIAALPYACCISHIGSAHVKDKNGRTAHLWHGTLSTVNLLSLVSLFIWFIILYQVFPGEFRSTLTFF